MTTAIGSGPLIPVVSSPSSPVQAGPVLPVYVYTSLPAGRSQSGAKPIPVKFLNASDLVQNGGSYTLAGPPTALPVISVAANVYGVQGGSALPVYDVTNLVYPQPQPVPPAPVLPDVASATLLLNLQADALALSDGDPVSTWADASGNGNDFTQTGSARPIFRVISGVPQVDPDGVDDWMLGPDFADNLSSMAILVILARPAIFANGNPILAKMSNTATGVGWHLSNYGRGILLQEDGGNNWLQFVALPPVLPDGAFSIVDWEWSSFATGNQRQYINGVRTADVDITDFSNPPVTNISTLEPVRLFTDGSQSGFFEVPVQAVMLYRVNDYAAWDASDRAAVEAWLAAKYGITL